MGLDPLCSDGVDGLLGDPDFEGITNIEKHQRCPDKYKNRGSFYEVPKRTSPGSSFRPKHHLFAENGIISAEGGMIAEELEKIVARHEMQCLELKELFTVERIDELFLTTGGSEVRV